MPVRVEITDADIDYAERILLPVGNVFDTERRDFIKNLETIDLQAVPGSGKTTALLAKLLIIDKKLPFTDGTGVLVISHTNVAVDEIKSKIGKHCSKLFSYPNYIGTIQSFVDKFLCLPCYANYYKRRINRIDNELYTEYVSKASKRSLSGFTLQDQNNAKRFLKVNGLTYELRMRVNNGGQQLCDNINGSEIVVKKPKGNTRPENYTDWTIEEKERVRKWCVDFKRDQLRSGILCYDDAYTFGEYMIAHFPRIVNILQTRFKYVFVDEMQDMAPHQYDILEKVFFDNGTSSSRYQRIGDKNQAIYGEENFSDVWEDRDQVLRLNGSHRLSTPIAALVAKFAVSPIAINGNGKNKDGSDIDIKPHIIVYDDISRHNVLPTFSEIITRLVDLGEISRDPANKYVAIGWRKEHPDADKIAIKDYFPPYTGNVSQSTIDYGGLSDYMVLKTTESSIGMGGIRTQIINGLLRVLRMELITDADGKAFTKTKLFRHLEDKDKGVINKFRLLLYQWSRDVAKGLSVIDSIKSYLPELVEHLGRNIDFSTNVFVNAPLTQRAESVGGENPIPLENSFTHNEMSIYVCTIHSVKGTTNTATLFLDTYNNKKYESERLKSQINGTSTECSALTGQNMKAAKMVYVGFSRPTHLLAFAVHKSRFDTLGVNATDNGIWEIIDISTPA